jgi:polo-like kinase 1
MNSYSFPDHTPISDNARNLISKILILDQTKRPTLDEMLASPFLNNVTYIPKALPLSTLACPPSTSFLKQYIPQGSNMLRSSQSQQKMFETAPNTQFTKAFSKEKTTNVQSTDNLKSFKPPGSAATILKTDQNTQNVDTVVGTSNNFVSTQNNYFKDQNKGSAASYRSEVKGLTSMKSIPSNGNFPNSVGMSSVNNFNRTKTLSNNNIMVNTVTAKPQEIWVKKWVDYSGKYGLGYLLSNGATGVYFNDSTKIILDPKATYFEYFEKKGTDNQDVVCSYHLNNFPANLQKKVTLLQHFRSYLEGDTKQKVIQDENEVEEVQKTQPLNYVKKWMKTKHAIMFRLSNKIVQVPPNFLFFLD